MRARKRRPELRAIALTANGPRGRYPLADRPSPRGAAVLLISEDLDEILELSDRILVMSDGKIVYETAAEDADPHLLGSHMAGHH